MPRGPSGPASPGLLNQKKAMEIHTRPTRQADMYNDIDGLNGILFFEQMTL
jgi:hypothetical protein